MKNEDAAVAGRQLRMPIALALPKARSKLCFRGMPAGLYARLCKNSKNRNCTAIYSCIMPHNKANNTIYGSGNDF
jgi:hypothetical protein